MKTQDAAPIRKLTTACNLISAVVFSFWVASTAAAQASGQFQVTATLLGPNSLIAPPASAFCIKTPEPRDFGATVTVVCHTGAQVFLSAPANGMPWLPTHGGAYRYLLQVRSKDDVLGTIDSYVGVGTTTSWRVVDVGDFGYLEMLLGW